MKKALSILLTVAMLLGVLTLTACGGSDSNEKKETKVDESKLSFTTVGELKSSGTEYAFIEAERRLEDDAVVCVIKADAADDVAIPAQHDGKDVVAVTSESQEGSDKLTALTVADGVSYIENCFGDNSNIKTVTLPATVKGVFHSFNHNTGLTEMTFPASVKYIVDAFCDCSLLEKIATNGFIYDVKDSFNDSMIFGATFNGSIQKIDNSFNNSALNSVYFSENIHDVTESFNKCAVLNSVTVKQIANIIKKSFCSDVQLTSVEFAQGAESILYSFNDNDSLSTVEFGGEPPITDSFQNCPNYTLPEAGGE